MHSRVDIELQGTVQGVGFRPAVYRLATAAGLSGWVRNCQGCVRLRVEGEADAVAAFIETFPGQLPPQAAIDRLTIVDETVIPVSAAEPGFRIEASRSGDEAHVAIPADLAICEACAAEIRDPAGRRFGYPFTTCTDCGPRYTVVRAMPYDRIRTTLAEFPLCDACRAEYENPADRRFHAESIACPTCGPQLTFCAMDGAGLTGEPPLRAARAALAAGRIVAVRGLGGFQLAVDAFNGPAIARLRGAKRRPAKPFAIMAADLDVIRACCEMPGAAVDLLQSPEAPIVILDTLSGVADPLPLAVLAPDARTVGVMLPTTPLHQLLLAPADPADPTPAFRALVMTSGNASGEPICTTTPEAIERLGSIADAMLTHNREVALRNDDSLATIQLGEPQIWRRARGYAPRPIRLDAELPECILGMGAELKNTVALGYDNELVMSPHVGDLATPKALDGFDQVVDVLRHFLGKQPDRIAVDLHPDMHATRTGRALAAELSIPVYEVQHHYAHACAGLAEHGWSEGLALIFDGTGLGTDGSIWGAELLHVGVDSWRRLATFVPVPLPGGDAAVRHPIRQVVARCRDAGCALPTWLARAYNVTDAQLAGWQLAIDRQLNAPLTHAAGRLFDSVSAFLGVAPATVTYEGQGPIRLEALAKAAPEPAADGGVFAYEARWLSPHLLGIDWAPAIRNLATFEDGISVARQAALARGFHEAVARAATEMVEQARDQLGCRCRNVVLGGGVFMNRLLTAAVNDKLRNRGFTVGLQRRIPPNDGGIAAGQVMAAAHNRKPCTCV